MTAKTTLVVVPTLNEAAHLRRVVDELFAGAEPGQQRLVVVDGGSDDGTPELAESLGRPEVSVLHNPRRLQSAAVNLAAAEAGEDVDIIVRADAHCSYPPGFVRDVSAALRERLDEGCVSVVVPMRTTGTAPVQRAVAATQNSVLGNGGAAHRGGGASRWIDHGHHAAMLRTALLAVGGYDETMPANEDAELDERLRANGGRIWFAGDLEITYYPRSTLRALARQYHAYGAGRATTVLRHGTPLKARQLAPVAITTAVAASVAVAPVRRRALLVPTGYAAACLAAAGREAVRSKDPALVLMAPAAVVQHVAWGSGFLRRVARELRTRGSGSAG